MAASISIEFHAMNVVFYAIYVEMKSILIYSSVYGRMPPIEDKMSFIFLFIFIHLWLPFGYSFIR